MARLIIVNGPGEGTEHDLEGARISIGRDPANTIVLGDSLVSKRHAEIIRDEDGSLRIVDVGSSNGTLVNDRQVVEHRLSHHDRIQLGEVRLRFEGDPVEEFDDEGAKTVLIDDAATRLAIPSEAVQAVRTPKTEPDGEADPESTIYISDDDGPTPAAAAPPAVDIPEPGPAPLKKKTSLPVMPILLSFIAVMIIIGCVLTWIVVQRSRGESAGTVQTAVVAPGGVSAADSPVTLPDQGEPNGAETAAAGPSTLVEEENLIAEPPESIAPEQTDPPAVTGSRTGQSTAAATDSRAATPPPTRTYTPPPPARSTTPPPPARSTTPPPPARTSSPPPARPGEVPPSTGGATHTAAPPPATVPAQPREVVPDATHGVLHVITKPEGATIYVNEELVGTANAKKRMSAGKYIIRLEHQGQTVTDDVKVKVQQVSTFYHDFTPPTPGRDEDDDDDDDEDDKDRKKKDKDDDDEDEDEDEDEDDEKKKKKGFKKRLKDIFG